MNKFSTLILLTFITSLLSCEGTKKVSAQQKEKNKTEMKSEIQTSAFAKLFINDLNKELEKQSKSIEQYKPTKELMDKYGIQFFNNEYYIQGFVTVNNALNKNKINNLNIVLGRQMGNKSTIRIPLKSFFQFLNLEGVEYFEMNPKSELK